MIKQLRFMLLACLLFVPIMVIAAQEAEETEEAEMPTVPYFQSIYFNVPVLEEWENQSTDSVAQFYNADAQATIRTAYLDGTDNSAGAKSDLEAFLDTSLDAALYSDKVNLDDGTWTVQIFKAGENILASAMSKQVDNRVYVVSFIETNPDVQIYMLAMERAEDALAGDPSQEIIAAQEALLGEAEATTDNDAILELASGTWHIRSDTDTFIGMGMNFGNDSFIALKKGDSINLPELADAYNQSLLGFFITPDNSGYLYLGLTVSFGILLILVGSIILRRRNLEKDIAVLQQLSKNDS